MEAREKQDLQPSEPNRLIRYLKDIASFVKGSIEKLRIEKVELDTDDTEGQKKINEMKAAGFEDGIIQQTIKTRAALFKAKNADKELEQNEKERLESDQHKYLQEKYQGLPEGAEVQTTTLSYQNISFENVDIAVKNGKIIKILNEGKALDSSGGTFNNEDLKNKLEPLQKLEIVMSSSGYEADEEVEHLSIVKFDTQKLNTSLEKGEIELMLLDDEVEMKTK
jgi:hypothetical protein